MKRATEDSAPAAIEAVAAQWVARRDAGLSSSDESALQRWLDADPRHRRALEFYDSAWSALARPARTGAAAEFERRVATCARRRRRRTGAFVLAAALGAGVLAWSLPRFSSAASNALVLTPPQQTLPDGSTVEFNGPARIEVEFSAGTRRVVLREGEAHFTVQKNPARPFVVSAGGVDVRAVGTAFSVQLSSTAVDVLVTAGRVVVDRPAPAAPTNERPPVAAPVVAVDAGKRVWVDIASTAALPAVSSPAANEWRERLAWRSPRLEFTRTRLAEAVALLNRHAPATAPRLVVGDSAVAEQRISGVFRADNTEAFVLLLEGAFNVKAERAGNMIALRRAE